MKQIISSISSTGGTKFQASDVEKKAGAGAVSKDALKKMDIKPAECRQVLEQNLGAAQSKNKEQAVGTDQRENITMTRVDSAAAAKKPLSKMADSFSKCGKISIKAQGIEQKFQIKKAKVDVAGADGGAASITTVEAAGQKLAIASVIAVKGDVQISVLDAASKSAGEAEKKVPELAKVAEQAVKKLK